MDIGIKVISKGTDYIDFLVNDDSNLYRYESFTGKMRKLFGFDSNFGKSVRGSKCKAIERLAKIAFDNNLPVAFSVVY